MSKNDDDKAADKAAKTQAQAEKTQKQAEKLIEELQRAKDDLQTTEHDLNARFAKLEAREKAANERDARRHGGGSRPVLFVPEKRVKKAKDGVRDYLRANYYQAGLRELQVAEAIFHVLLRIEED